MVYRALYWFFVFVGRPFGGVRPRRITHWLQHRGFVSVKPAQADFRWYRDREGYQWLLHPHFHIDSLIIAFGEFEPDLCTCIKRNVRPGMVCLDVGANMGVISLRLARRVGPSGAVHCFEPVPHVFDRLAQHVQRNGLQDVVHAHRVALSHETGSMEMSVADPLEVNQGMGSLVRKADVLSRRISVEVLTLDDFAERARFDRLDFVKLDIQGAEPFFLAGGERTLRRFKPLMVVELSPVDLAGAGKTSKDLLAQIEALGYEVYKLGRNGEEGSRLFADNIPADFHEEGVLCRAASSR